MTVRIEAGDMRAVLAKMIADGVRVHSIVTDPPYHLTAGKKGGSGAASLNVNSPAGRSRISTGFMGTAWDGGDIAFQPETWRLCYELLPPGGHLVAFSGTRTYHRMACAIEDAGFEVRDMVSWIFASGFPKSHNVAKGIDKAAGREIEIVPRGAPVKRMIPGAEQAKHGWEKNNGREYQPGDYVPSEEAAPWLGWGTALKPALEPICLARKPLDGTVAGNVLAHGTGAINIDGCRIDGESTVRLKNGGRGQFPHEDDAWEPKTVTVGSDRGRWPANVVLSFPEDEYALRPDVTAEEKRELYRWLSENT